MSTKFEKDLDSFLFFGGPFPNLAEGVTEIPLPQGFYICMTCKKVTNYWEPGWICDKCEYESEQQEGQNSGN